MKKKLKFIQEFISIFVILLIVISIGYIGDFKKAKAASGCDTLTKICTISDNGSIDGGNSPVFHFADSSSSFALTNPVNEMDVIITGPITIITKGTLTFQKNLTITNGAKVTQEEIIRADIDLSKPVTDPNYLKSSGQLKKVDLIIPGKLTVENNARIDVYGKGFPGADNNQKGYGPGGGGCISDPKSGQEDVGTGGAYGGKAYSSDEGGCTVQPYGDLNAPNQNGSGGSLQTIGGDGIKSGGGIIKITAQDMDFKQGDQTFISASGEDGYTTANKIYYFGGSGGSVWIKVNGKLSLTYAPPGEPSALGNSWIDGNSTVYGDPGTVIGGGNGFSKYIVANGGIGGGAGGRIKLEIADFEILSCYITGGTEIPAACENDDVTVDTAIVNVRGQRNFNSLKIKNGGIVTHEPLVPGTDFNISNNSLNTIKKVDLKIATDLTLESGGKIDVTGKGYPGGRILNCSINVNPSDWTNGYGYGRGNFAQGNAGDYAYGSGGGYFGDGGNGVSFSNPSPYSVSGGQDSRKPNIPEDIGYGAGGGASQDHKWSGTENYTGCSYGGDGGGMIILDVTGKVIFNDSTSVISANGGKPLVRLKNSIPTIYVDPDTYYCVGSCDERETFGGGGSGGYIRIKTPQIIYPSTGYSAANVDGGPWRGSECGNVCKNGLPGKIINNRGITINNIFVNGGKGGGGGGGGVIIIEGEKEIRKIKVKVRWVERGQNKEVNFTEVLSDIR